MIIADKNTYICQQLNNEEIRILRVYGAFPQLEIPEKLGGYLVREIGPYCLAPNKKMQNDLLEECKRVEGELSGSFYEIAGKDVESVVLPNSVTTLHSYSFYNCKNLERLTVGGKLCLVNGDSFMNCSRLRKLTLKAPVQEATGLQFLLNQLKGEIEVIFSGEEEAHILFPEYSENYEEIGPAHIFHLQVEGEGFRARKQFRDGVFDIKGYDRIFETAVGRETPGTLVQMAAMRLCQPVQLEEEGKSLYEAFVKENERVLVDCLLKEENQERILYLCKENIFSDSAFALLLQGIAEKGWTKLNAAIIREKARKAVDLEYVF